MTRHSEASGKNRKDVFGPLNHTSCANLPTLEERPVFVSREKGYEVNLH